MQARYRLGIISNVDDDLFAGTADLLGIDFDWVVTAQQAQSYKPSHNNFHLALKTMGLPKEKVLHVAESVRHDVIPAKELGFDVVWINRSQADGRASVSGADGMAGGDPDMELPDLETLVSVIEESVGGQKH